MRKIKYIKSEDPRSADFDAYIKTNYSLFLTETDPELILVTGGDGAMLHAIQQHRHCQVPFVGHAAGSLNFLMNSLNDFEETLNKLLDNQFKLHILETTSIQVDLFNKDAFLCNLGDAVNEVVFGSDVMGYHSYNITSEDGSFDNFNIKGSGLSVSTDLGSTGYNFNLGGSVLPLGSNLWSVVGVVCNRYLNDIVPIQKVKISDDSKSGDISVFIDGMKIHYPLKNGQVVVLSKGNGIKLTFLNKLDFIKKRIDITSRYRKS